MLDPANTDLSLLFSHHWRGWCILDRQQKEEAAAKAAIKQKGKRNTKLLSFEEEEEEAEQDFLAKSKIRSYHDVVDDKR